MFDSSTITLFICLTVAMGLLIIVGFVLLGMWVWMINDWTKRMNTDPATAEHYKIQMLLGWPVSYYRKVYLKNGPAQCP